MGAEERRASIFKLLQESDKPVSATALARTVGVSRQVVVGDIALLRAGGTVIASTPRGYILPQIEDGTLRTLVCRHTAADLERELNLIVDNGCTAVDVSVEHPVYGVLSGQLEISSRYDVQEFARKVRTQSAAPLSALTGGVHLHTLRCPDEAAFQRVRAALREAGFLVEA